VIALLFSYVGAVRTSQETPVGLYGLLQGQLYFYLTVFALVASTACFITQASASGRVLTTHKDDTSHGSLNTPANAEKLKMCWLR
jgi:hypothetical protein